MKKVIEEGYREKERKEQEEKREKEDLKRSKNEWENEIKQKWLLYDLAEEERERKKKRDKFKPPMIPWNPFFEPDPDT